MEKINLYDFDKTIYHGDSSTHFFFFSLRKYPSIIFLLPRIASAFFRYKFKRITKTEMKGKFFSFVKRIPDIDKHIELFWNTHKKNMKKYYMEKDHSRDIIISASPEFLLKPIIDTLGVKDFFASVVDKKSGEFLRENCHGKEKVVRLNEKYKSYEVLESYSDALCDKPILELAKKAYMVKGEKLTPIKF